MKSENDADEKDGEWDEEARVKEGKTGQRCEGWKTERTGDERREEREEKDAGEGRRGGCEEEKVHQGNIDEG